MQFHVDGFPSAVLKNSDYPRSDKHILLEQVFYNQFFIISIYLFCLRLISYFFLLNNCNEYILEVFLIWVFFTDILVTVIKGWPSEGRVGPSQIHHQGISWDCANNMKNIPLFLILKHVK